MPKGFTLMELLLVLVLLAGSSVAVIMTFSDSPRDQLAETAKAFHQRLLLLSEEAMLNGRDYGVHVSENQYRFLALDGKKWTALEGGLFETVEVPENSRLFLSLGSAAWEDSDRLFEPSSLFEPSRFEEKDKIEPPQVWVMSSGEITPFTLRFESKTDQKSGFWQATVTESSDIQLLAPFESAEQ